MRTVALIPARSGSKRISNKNIKDFLGKPIITYPVETAKASKIFDDIVVYSDSEEIRKLSRELSVKAYFRITSDTETLTETISKFIINEYQDDIDYLCVLLPTAVFVTNNELQKGYLSVSETRQGFLNKPIEDNDCAITFCKYSHPIQRAFYYSKAAESMMMVNSACEFIRTQDCETNYYDAGQMYFFHVKSFLKQKRIFLDNIYPIIIDAVDIDNPEDWKKAEAYYKVIHG